MSGNDERYETFDEKFADLIIHMRVSGFSDKSIDYYIVLFNAYWKKELTLRNLLNKCVMLDRTAYRCFGKFFRPQDICFECQQSHITIAVACDTCEYFGLKNW